MGAQTGHACIHHTSASEFSESCLGYLYVYVCMHECMHACMYVCMHADVCKYVRMYLCLSAQRCIFVLTWAGAAYELRQCAWISRGLFWTGSQLSRSAEGLQYPIAEALDSGRKLNA